MKNVSDVYPLSPMQEGMLFHILYEPSEGAYVVHVSFTIEGVLNVPVFKRCWQQIVERHSSLRTAFRWEHLERPLQIVQTEAALSCDELDWRQLSNDQQLTQMEPYVQKLLVRGFDLTQAPLMRIGLLRLADNRYAFILQYSHLVLDGWSVNLVFKELFQAYGAHISGKQLHWPPSRRYRDFILWMQKQDKDRTEAFWRKNLQGFSTPTPLQFGVGGTAGQTEGTNFVQSTALLNNRVVDKLKAISRQNRITLNSFVQGAWAKLLAQYSGKAEVLFGVAVTGRPVSLPGADAIVGLLMSTLPLRVHVPDHKPVLNWLRSLQEHQAELLEYQHSSLVEIKSWSEIQGTLPLFESCVIFENQPGSGQLREFAAIRCIPGRVIERGAFPWTLVAEPGEEMILRVIIDSRRFDRNTASVILHHLQALLSEFAENPQQEVGELSLLRADEKKIRIELEKSEPGNVEAINSLSPVQEEILATIRSQVAGDHSSEQLMLRIAGNINEEFLKQALARIPDRFDCLRTSFHWQLVGQPLQAVHHDVELPCRIWDCVDQSKSEKHSLVQELLKADRVLGFDLSKAPLVRVNALRLAEDDWRILITYHPLVLDMLSVRPLIESFVTAYSALCEGQQVSFASKLSYQDYIHWLQKKDEGAAKAFWRKQMEGFDSAIPLSSVLPSASLDIPGTFREIHQTWDEYLISDLKAFAFAHHVSLTTAIAGAWSVLLARYTGQNDVLFGVVMPASVAELSRFDTTAGRFLNPLPLRVAANESDLISAWLREIEHQRNEMLDYAHNSLTQIQTWAGLQAGTMLFDHLLVFEKFSQSWTLPSATGPLSFEYEIAGGGHYPLILSIHIGTEAQLRCRYNTAHFEEQRIQSVLRHLRQLVAELLQYTERRFHVSVPAPQNGLPVSS